MGIIALCSALLAGCSIKDHCNSNNTTQSPRIELAEAPDLDINTATADEYNCYGNATKKKIVASPKGYVKGESTKVTFGRVIRDIGEEYVRKLDGPYDDISEDEYVVVMRCGPNDFHFIRLTPEGWYNKSGTTGGLYVDEEVVFSKTWYGRGIINGVEYVIDSIRYEHDPYGTIYFAIKEGWDSQ